MSLEGIQEGFSPEENEDLQILQPKLTDFILHLTQAFLGAGYYTPENPESKKAKEGLYQQFKSLFIHEDGLTLLVSEDQEGKEIFIEGVLPQAQKLSRMVAKGMGDLYIPRLAQCLEQKDLISLTLKSRMGQEEFTRFIEVMSEFTLVDSRRKEDQERFVQTLLRREIFNLSFLFGEEVLAPARQIPWRARLLLSRMRKDLQMIPYLQKRSGQELPEIRQRLIQDVIRPIPLPDLLYTVLKNSDLAATPENPEEILENGIISSLPAQHLLKTAKFFLREQVSLQQLQDKDDGEVKSGRLAQKISRGLKENGTPEAENLLEELFRNQLVRLGELPPLIQDKILVEKAVDKLLQGPDFFFQKLDQARGKEDFLFWAYPFAKMMPELIRRDQYPEVLRILQSLRGHLDPGYTWAPVAGQILEEMEKGSIPVLLKEKFLRGKKEVRLALGPIFKYLGPEAIPHLFAILKTSEDQSVRKSAGEALIQIGPEAISHLLKEMEEPLISDGMTGDILRILGEIQSPQWKGPLVKILQKYTFHGNPKLREQAIHTLCLVAGPEKEEIFLFSLDDPDLEVQKRAVWCLGMIKSVQGAKRMVEILNQIASAPSGPKEPLETQIYHAFGAMGNLMIEGRTIEQILLAILEERGIKKWGGLFQKKLLPDSALAAILGALGKIGTERSIVRLKKIEKSQRGTWVPRMGEVIKRIEKRAGTSYPYRQWPTGSERQSQQAGGELLPLSGEKDSPLDWGGGGGPNPAKKMAAMARMMEKVSNTRV